MIVSALRPDPIVIPLDDPPGKTYRRGDISLRFQIVRGESEAKRVEVTLSRDNGPTTGRYDPTWPALRRRIAFEDRDGRPLSWFLSGRSAQTGTEARYGLQISQGRGPIRLRFHEIVWSATEIPFEFADVPLP